MEKIEILITKNSYNLFKELLTLHKYLHLIKNLTKKNISDNHDSQKLSYTWSIVRPLLYVLVAILLKGASGANLDNNLIAYPLFVYIGLSTWWFFAESSRNVARSIYKDSSTINKIYFPRIISPLTQIISSFFDYILRLSIVPFFLLYFGYSPNLSVIFIFIPIITMVFFALGLGLIVMSLSLNFRDAEKALAHLMHLGLFLSPIWYSFEILPLNIQFYAYIFNPIASQIDLVRYLLSGGIGQINLSYLLVNFTSSIVILFIGFIFFSKVQGRFSDR